MQTNLRSFVFLVILFAIKILAQVNIFKRIKFNSLLFFPNNIYTCLKSTIEILEKMCEICSN